VHIIVNKLRQNVGLETGLWRQIVTSQTAHTKYKWLPYATEWKKPHENFLRTSLFLSSFSVSCSLASPLTDALSVFSQSNLVEHVKSLLLLSMGLFALAKMLKDGAFSSPTAMLTYLLLSWGEPWYNRSLCMWLWIKTLFKCLHILPVVPEWQEQVLLHGEINLKCTWRSRNVK